MRSSIPRPLGEVLVPIAPPVVSLTKVRSTLVIASRDGLQALGVYERYLEHLSPTTRETLEGMVPGAWVDVPIAVEHYRACESLSLPIADQVALGARAFERMKGTLVGTAVKLATNAGATPWTLLPQVDRFWNRAWVGSAIGVTKTGPKEVICDVAGCPLVVIPYFRTAFRGVTAGIVGLFCQRCYVTEVAGQLTSSSVAFRVQWV